MEEKKEQKMIKITLEGAEIKISKVIIEE